LRQKKTIDWISTVKKKNVDCL